MAEPLVFEPERRAIPYVIEGDGPVVVLLPDRGLEIGYLGPLAHSLASEDFRVVRIGWGNRDASPQELAEDVVAVLEQAGVADGWIGGHGFGGTVARVLTHAHHERANGLLLLGVEAGADGPAVLADGIPVLVVQGAEDTVTPPANGEALRASAPGLVSVVTVDGGEHLFPATHVGATSWAIEDYLDWD
ncbi:alpha/beta fold hydrolase [Microbacterium sp. SORGH_AS_0888]|uniref:alpha/beta fold hydrolase n=1 Tax=Microbacterium sp. SORGH_AS_0888 TaxID=3041791 RepID=UPI002783D5F7|nr:alpha/beta hydrolase [Microbacterium sp. SORGH_AS_0888]MDQ1128146.1 pimeloyl-ACP methyl ester carboxylesterase [Microbacterium sp. SORGH_AS_0888]